MYVGSQSLSSCTHSWLCLAATIVTFGCVVYTARNICNNSNFYCWQRPCLATSHKHDCYVHSIQQNQYYVIRKHPQLPNCTSDIASTVAYTTLRLCLLLARDFASCLWATCNPRIGWTLAKCSLLIGQYPHHTTHLPSSFYGERCYGIRL